MSADNIQQLEMDGMNQKPAIDLQHLRIIEAVLFASSEPLSEKLLAARLPEDANIIHILAELQETYAERGINLVHVGEKWAFRTAIDLAGDLHVEVEKSKKMTRATLETLAIIAYHEPVTRSEIEEIRGVALSKGTLDILLEAKWIRPRGRKRVPGRPVLWATTDEFLDHFGLQNRDDLPGLSDLKAAGLLDSRPGMGRYGASSGDDSLLPEPEDDPSSTESAVEEALTSRNLAELDAEIYAESLPGDDLDR
ncbi:SMC-Scp complex subunit ScpB [Thalassospira marina]|uniref:SMC-Scp complex subunit ScpB n=1 Tax=Thalassospira marina TaxID=2048283 RepID=A0ABN5FDD7_9PROT|nr:SMC-Scp complex subunit ScpB [Thalassospira marina]AUG52857.1 SMC-Scp complex subunit ScpB [Thalassospira marina]